MSRFEPMPDDFEPTRATLHQYANAVGVIPRAHAAPHEKWWHVSLGITGRGLETATMKLPAGDSLALRLDLHSHEVVIAVGGEDRTRIDMTSGLTGTEMGNSVIAAVAELGLGGEYARDKFESDELRHYSPTTAAAFDRILNEVHAVCSQHRDRIGQPVSPIRLWPHGFDMAFEWFGTRVEEYEEHGEVQRYPAQCNFGFYPGGRAYLYANPWPFEADALLGVELPGGATWHTAGWQGSILYYDQLVGDDNAASRVLDYFGAVFDAAAPTLTA